MGTEHLDTAELVAAYQTGEAAASIARRFRVSTWAVITQLREAGVEIPARVRHLEDRELRSGSGSLLYTPAYVEMKAQRQRWYPEGTKRVPRDLRLTPLVVAHWFSGDGTTNEQGVLSFCTDGFVQEDTEFLTARLGEDLGIHAVCREGRREGQFKIGIYREAEAVKPKGLIEPFMPECCLTSSASCDRGRGKVHRNLQGESS